MAAQLERVIMCPICLDTMSKPIIQCQTGHSMCGNCVQANSVKSCPQCRGPITKTRNYQLEQLIDSLPKDMKTPCFFSDRGCKYLLTSKERDEHEAECKNRKFLCEGRKFAKWKCEWFGNYDELERHFKEVHGSEMGFKMEKTVAMDLTKEHRDVQIISFFNGAQYFWYKHMVDVVKQKVYWTFQYVGPRKQAQNYYYEFEIVTGPIKKFKVTEICDNDVVKAEKLFDEEKCVALSFKALKNYLDDHGRLTFKYRVMSIKKPNETSKSYHH